MRAGTYYAIAAVLLLATVPMYRYIFQQARVLSRVDGSVPLLVSPVLIALALSVLSS